MSRRIRLRGITGAIRGRLWESAAVLRIGRHDSCEIHLDDQSVSRQHAEIRLTERGWRLRDLGSTNGTFINSNRLGQGAWPLSERDLVEVGEFTLVVETINDAPSTEQMASSELPVQATARASLEEALEALAFTGDHGPRPVKQLLALLRASHHLGHAQSLDELLRSILDDAVEVLDAQRGSIVLADGPEGKLRVCAVTTGRNNAVSLAAGREPTARPSYSQSLAARCLTRNESILCHNVAADSVLGIAESTREGAMDSVLGVLLRTPRARLGILHLDRGPHQERFTAADLQLGDALAASVSAGIECAELLRKQRELFLNTIAVLGQAIEMRDEYTGGHTARVTMYARMLAKQLNVSAEEIELIRMGTPLHDIGKIGIDDAILRKTDKLTPDEYEAMKLHTVKGDEILATIPDLLPVRPIVRSHHERWDGRGYPDGLAGEKIPRIARIVAVADAFDAMTSDRPYRKGMPMEAAFTEVENQAGRQFDPECAVAFLALRERLKQAVATTMRPAAGRPTTPLNRA